VTNLCTVLRLVDGDQSLAPEALGAASHDHQAAVVAVVQSLSCVWLFVTPWTIPRQASLSFTISRSLLKFMSFESVMPSNHLFLCRPLLLLPSIFPNIRVFSNESALHIRWSNYCSFSISPSNEYSGLISFRIDWFDLLAVQLLLFGDGLFFFFSGSEQLSKYVPDTII